MTRNDKLEVQKLFAELLINTESQETNKLDQDALTNKLLKYEVREIELRQKLRELTDNTKSTVVKDAGVAYSITAANNGSIHYEQVELIEDV